MSIENLSLSDSLDNKTLTVDEKLAFLYGSISAKKPWYRDVSSLIALTALVLSLSTTIVGGYRSYQQSIEDRKIQLHAALNAVSVLSLQNVDATIKYKDTPYLFQVTSAINTQSAFAAKQAYSLVISLGNSATTLDLLATSFALGTLNEVALSEKLLEAAVNKKPDNIVEYLAVYQQLGDVRLYNRELGKGDEAFTKAYNAFDVFPVDANNHDFLVKNKMITQMKWASSLLSFNCRLAMPHFVAAKQLFDDDGHNSAGVGFIKADLDRLDSQISQCR